MSDMGDWLVDVEDEVPDHVSISFTEFDNEGVLAFKCYMTPEGAIAFANAVIEKATEIT